MYDRFFGEHRDITTPRAGPVTDLQVTSDGLRLCSVSEDKTLKIYDVSSFDMVNMLTLPCSPSCCTWIETKPSTHAKARGGQSSLGLVGRVLTICPSHADRCGRLQLTFNTCLHGVQRQ